MDVTPLVKSGAQIIQSYAGGRFKISGQEYEGALLVSPDRCVVWDGADTVESLSLESFQQIAESFPETDVVLLGTGARVQMLPAELRAELKELPFTADMMDTGAACRTYNVIMAEGRRVVAALLPAS